MSQGKIPIFGSETDLRPSQGETEGVSPSQSQPSQISATARLSVAAQQRLQRVRATITPKQALGLTILLSVTALVLAAGSSGWQLLPTGVEVSRGNATVADVQQAGSTLSSEIYVHIAGEVRYPGVYVLDESARIIDAVAAAGGLTEAAVVTGINLARLLKDGEQVIIHSTEQLILTPAETGLININLADAAALESLPRIGPALAERIINWRKKHGSFSDLSDLLEVSGIGPAVLAEIEDRITF